MKTLLQEEISNIRRVMGIQEALGAPLDTITITDEFGSQRKGYKHAGVDLSVPSGTKVIAIDDGVVLDAEIRNNNCGGTLEIEHSGGFKSRFCHLKQIDVRKGDKVVKGQLVALSGGEKGDTGSGRSTGPHLHFELKKNNTLVNPMSYIDKGDYNPIDTSGDTTTEYEYSQSTFDPNVGKPSEDFGLISQIFKGTGAWKNESITESQIKIQPGYIRSMVSGRVVDENFTDDQCSGSLTIMYKIGNDTAYVNYCSIENPIVKVGENVKKGDKLGYSDDAVTAFFYDRKGNPLNIKSTPNNPDSSKNPERKKPDEQEVEDKISWFKEGPYYGNLSDVLKHFGGKINPLSSRYDGSDVVHQGGLKGMFGKGPKLPYSQRIKYTWKEPDQPVSFKKKKSKPKQPKKNLKEDIEQIKKLMK